MIEVCLEYKDFTKYFHNVKSISIKYNKIFLFNDYGMLGILDFDGIENINIYRLTNEGVDNDLSN